MDCNNIVHVAVLVHKLFKYILFSTFTFHIAEFLLCDEKNNNMCTDFELASLLLYVT